MPPGVLRLRAAPWRRRLRAAPPLGHGAVGAQDPRPLRAPHRLPWRRDPGRRPAAAGPRGAGGHLRGRRDTQVPRSHGVPAPLQAAAAQRLHTALLRGRHTRHHDPRHRGHHRGVRPRLLVVRRNPAAPLLPAVPRSAAGPHREGLPPAPLAGVRLAVHRVPALLRPLRGHLPALPAQADVPLPHPGVPPPARRPARLRRGRRVHPVLVLRVQRRRLRAVVRALGPARLRPGRDRPGAAAPLEAGPALGLRAAGRGPDHVHGQRPVRLPEGRRRAARHGPRRLPLLGPVGVPLLRALAGHELGGGRRPVPRLAEPQRGLQSAGACGTR
mmetsp:Transcript_109243/g.309063  ORF Transcript_109243/g.309063 Transcript_109243/m.309063 type:complete len:328 (+) Transcript_109243:152-1135(+)